MLTATRYEIFEAFYTAAHKTQFQTKVPPPLRLCGLTRALGYRLSPKDVTWVLFNPHLLCERFPNRIAKPAQIVTSALPVPNRPCVVQKEELKWYILYIFTVP